MVRAAMMYAVQCVAEALVVARMASLGVERFVMQVIHQSA
jgi:hypothetical protein